MSLCDYCEEPVEAPAAEHAECRERREQYEREAQDERLWAKRLAATPVPRKFRGEP